MMESATFQHCLRSMPATGIISCAGRQALLSLQHIQDIDNYTIASGLQMIRDDSLLSGRSQMTSFLDQDPMDFRGMLENAGAIVGQRSLQWDLGLLQPGLCLRIGPTTESNSMLEFIMDPNHDRGDRYLHEEEPSTARILAKQFIVPFLLGLKFNLITILPLFFAGIILLCKKAAFLGKIALFVSGLFGYGSVFSLGSLFGLGSGIGGGLGAYGGGGGYYGVNRPIVHDGLSGGYPDILAGPGGYYKTQDIRREQTAAASQPEPPPTPTSPPIIDTFYDFEKKLQLQDRNSKLYEKDLDGADSNHNRNGYRTFVWNTN